MTKKYCKPSMSLEEMALGDNILSDVTSGGTPSFDGYLDDSDFVWDE